MIAAVLTWEQHDRRHPPHPLSTNTGRTYVLDESDLEGILWCHRCGRYVLPRDDSDDDQAQ